MLITDNDPPYDSERAYDAVRLASYLLKQEPELDLRIFLVGDAVAWANGGQSVPIGCYLIENMLKGAVRRNGVIGVSGTCGDARGITEAERVEGTRRSSLDEGTEWVLSAEMSRVF